MMRQTRKRLVTGLRGLSLGVVMLLGAGCVMHQSPVQPPYGGLFTEIKAPLTVDFDNTKATTATRKVSRQETYYIFDYILTGINLAWDSAKIADIAREGGIEEVAYADYELKSILGIYAVYTINVYGN